MGIGHLLIYGVIGLCWWGCVFIVGLFQTVMWTIILTSIFVIYSPPSACGIIDCASGSHHPTTASLVDVSVVVLLSVTYVLTTSAFLVAIIVSCNVVKIPVAEYVACANDSGSGSVELVEDVVSLNTLSPVLKRGLPLVFGLGIEKIPETEPAADVTKLPPSEPPVGVQKELTLTLSKKG